MSVQKEKDTRKVFLVTPNSFRQYQSIGAYTAPPWEWTQNVICMLCGRMAHTTKCEPIVRTQSFWDET